MTKKAVSSKSDSFLTQDGGGLFGRKNACNDSCGIMGMVGGSATLLVCLIAIPLLVSAHPVGATLVLGLALLAILVFMVSWVIHGENSESEEEGKRESTSCHSP